MLKIENATLSLVERRFELVLIILPEVVGAATDECDCADTNGNDQSNHHSVLDNRRTIFLAQESR